MIAYFDASAYAKNYIVEPGRDLVIEYLQRADAAALHEISYVEISSALARAFREHRLTEAQWREAQNQFDQDWESVLVVTCDTALVRAAAALTRCFPLKAYDAVHLASAIILRDASELPVDFVCFDDSLNKAAKKSGFDVLDV